MSISPLIQGAHRGFWEGVNTYGTPRGPVELLDIILLPPAAEGAPQRLEFVARPLGMVYVRLRSFIPLSSDAEASAIDKGYEAGRLGGQALAEFVHNKVDEQFWKERYSGHNDH